MFGYVYGSDIEGVYQEACAILRPNWDGISPSALTELFQLALEPVSIILLIATVGVFWSRSFWVSLITSLLWTLWVADIVVQFAVHDPLFTAQEWGCIGNIELFIGFAIALCATMMVYTSYLRFFRSETEA